MSKHVAMTEADKELIAEKFKGVYGRLDANNEILHAQLTAILDTVKRTEEQTIKTNGRVTKLENGTSVVRWFEEKPKRFLIVMIPQILYVKEARDAVFEYFSQFSKLWM